MADAIDLFRIVPTALRLEDGGVPVPITLYEDFAQQLPRDRCISVNCPSSIVHLSLAAPSSTCLSLLLVHLMEVSVIHQQLFISICCNLMVYLL